MILSSTSPVTELSLIYQKVNQERMPKGFHKGLCISMMDAIVLKQYKKEHVKQLESPITFMYPFGIHLFSL